MAVAAIVLAAGLSSRMPGGNKLLADLGGVPVLVRTLRAIEASVAEPVLVVTGHDAGQVAELIQDFDVTLVHNSEFSSGMASSIVAGVRALPDLVDGVLICLGDMPAVSHGVIDALVSAFDADAICVPQFQDKRGHPVLFGQAFFPQLLALSGDQGAKRLLVNNADAVRMVDVPDRGILLDADTPEGLERLSCFFS